MDESTELTTKILYIEYYITHFTDIDVNILRSLDDHINDIHGGRIFDIFLRSKNVQYIQKAVEILSTDKNVYNSKNANVEGN